MTEKKYMTASEFIDNYTQDCITLTNMETGEINSTYDENKFKEELDTHFINKDLLKDKIKLILDKHRDRFPTSIENGTIIYREEIEKEILEMLK